MKVRTTRRGRLFSALILGAMAALVLPMSSAPAAAGNNGTVKIDGVEFDSYPNNEPHVGCVFQVDFYGFDEGNYNAIVRFSAQPPTGKSILLDNDLVFIGEDSAAGGGSLAGLDAERTYNLAPYLALYMAHPQQGYHIKLKVRAPGSIGRDTKYKVFWVTGCGGY